MNDVCIRTIAGHQPGGGHGWERGDGGRGTACDVSANGAMFDRIHAQRLSLRSGLPRGAPSPDPLQEHTVKRQLLGLTLGLGLLTTACQHTPPAPVVKIGPIQPQSFASQWKAKLDIGADRITELHVRGGRLFVYTKANDSYVLTADGGSIVSSAHVTAAANRLFPPVVLGKEVVYPTSTALEVYDLLGRQVRSIDTSSSIRSGAVGENNTVYFGTDYPRGGRLVAYNVQHDSGMPVWQIMTPDGAIESTPAISQAIIFFATTDGQLIAVSEDRNAIWPLDNGSFKTEGRITADVQADETGVYFASTDTKLYALERTTGKLKWTFFAGQSLTQSPVLGKKMVYQPVGQRGIIALDKVNGDYSRKPLWTAPQAVQVLAEDDQYSYLLEADRHIAAYDKATGEVRFRSIRTDFEVFATNMGADGLIYAARTDGDVYAVKPIMKAGVVGELVLVPVPMDAMASMR